MSRRRKYRFRELTVNDSYTHETDDPEFAQRDAKRIREASAKFGERCGRSFVVRVEHTSVVVRRIS